MKRRVGQHDGMHWPRVRHVGRPCIPLELVAGVRHLTAEGGTVRDLITDVRLVHAHDVNSVPSARDRAAALRRPWGATVVEAAQAPRGASLVLVPTRIGTPWLHGSDGPLRPLWVDDEPGATAADVAGWWRALAAGRPLPAARAPVTSLPTFTVVVPTFQRRALLKQTLEALAEQDYPNDLYEVVVVDNGSTDGTAAWLAAGMYPQLPRLRVLTNARNERVTTARNRAVADSRSDLVAFTDDDCRPEPGWLSGLAASAREGVGLVQGLTRGDPQQPRAPLSRSQDTPFGYGLFETCNIAYRRAALPDPPFDSSLPEELVHRFGDRFLRDPAGEDTDLGWRVAAAGWETRFTATAEVRHEVFPPDTAYLLRRARLVGVFPVVVRRHPQLRRSFLTHRIFLSAVQPTVYAAALGVVGAAITRRPAALILTAPYLALRLRPLTPGRRARLAALATHARVDMTTTGTLLMASIKTRTPVL